MGKALPKWVLYNIIHTHARAHAVGFMGGSAGSGGCSAPVFSREERTNKILGGPGAGAQPGMLRDFFGKWPL